jgi:hypothetical protein
MQSVSPLKPACRPAHCCLHGCPPLPPLSQEAAMRAIDVAVAAGRATRATLASRRTGRRVSVVLRPGDTDQLQPNRAIGIPNWVPSEKVPEQGCHAGERAAPAARGGARCSRCASASGSVPSPNRNHVCLALAPPCVAALHRWRLWSWGQ